MSRPRRSIPWVVDRVLAFAEPVGNVPSIVSVLGVRSFPLLILSGLLIMAAPAPACAGEKARPLRVTPERRALLNTIRFAEGTWKDGTAVGYRVMFGGGLFKNLQRHPDRVIRRWPFASAAAGAYQFLPATWRMAKKALQLRDFGPRSQDQAALYLIRKRGALNLADRGRMTPQLAAKLAPEWASFPTRQGRSYYPGQPVKRFDLIKRFYATNLASLRRNAPQWSARVSPPPLFTVASRTAHKNCAGSNNTGLLCLLDQVAYRGNTAAPVTPTALGRGRRAYVPVAALPERSGVGAGGADRRRSPSATGRQQQLPPPLVPAVPRLSDFSQPEQLPALTMAPGPFAQVSSPPAVEE